MILIKHVIGVDLEDGKYLLINSLNGLMDKVGEPVVNIIKKWREVDGITPENDFEVSLYNALQSKGYLVNSRAEEEAKKNDIIKVLRENHQANADICKAMTFILTYDCNFRCPYCYECDVAAKKAVMTPEQIDAALEFAGDSLQAIGLFGGEPLMPSCRPSLEYLISKTPGKKYHIITNGYYLLEFYDLLSSLDIMKIIVTLDGEEEDHNKRRFLEGGRPTFQKIMQGVEHYLDASMPICIRMNLDDSNFEAGNRLRESLLERFAKHGELLTFEMSSMLSAGYDDETNIWEALYEKDAHLDNDERLRQNQLLSRSDHIINAFTQGTKLSPTYSFCYAHASNKYLVDPYGHIYPCLVSVGKEELAIGTYYPEVKFKENSIHNRNIESIPKCRNCEYSLLCGGGCPLRLPSYKDVLKPDCSHTRNQIHVMLPKIYKVNQHRTRGDKLANPIIL